MRLHLRLVNLINKECWNGASSKMGEHDDGNITVFSKDVLCRVCLERLTRSYLGGVSKPPLAPTLRCIRAQDSDLRHQLIFM